MDRRRFVPAPEGLEVRTMLATTTGSGFSLFGNSSNTTQSLPITLRKRSCESRRCQPISVRCSPTGPSLP